MHVVDELDADPTAISGNKNGLFHVRAIVCIPTRNEFIKTDASAGNDTITDETVKNSLDKRFLVSWQVS